MSTKILVIQETIKTFEIQAKKEVEHAITLNMNDVINPHTYLYSCINAFAEYRENSEIGIIANLDAMYRNFVLAILKEAKKKNLVNYNEFFKGVLIGR